MLSREVLEQVCLFCDSQYCSIREFNRITKRPIAPCQHTHEEHSHCPNLLILMAKGDDRVLLQLKCIEELKYIRGQETGRHIDWEEAAMAWVDEGYAKKFAEVYSRGVRDIFFFFKEGTVPQRPSYCKPFVFDEEELRGVGLTRDAFAVPA